MAWHRKGTEMKNVGQYTAGFLAHWNRLQAAIAPAIPDAKTAMREVEALEEKLATLKGALQAIKERQR